MDTVTHALLGAAISDCWFRKRLGSIATPFALLVAALPDVDVVTYCVAPDFAWASHRGMTHSFFPMLLAAPLLGVAGYALSRKFGAWRQWTALAVLCLFSHTILDLTTSWGTMPWLPFSNARISWDVAPILDAFIFAVACASFVANRLLRWERVETFLNPLKYPVVHRHPRRQRIGDWVAKTAVALIMAYLLVGWQQNRQTVRLAHEELAKAGIEAEEVRALPIMFTYVAWDVIARDAAGTIYHAPYSGFAKRPMRFERYAALPREEVSQELSTPEGKLFSWFSQDMFIAERLPWDEGSRVRLLDRRFFIPTQPSDSRFIMEFDRDSSGKISAVHVFQMGLKGVDLRRELRALWELMRTGEIAVAPETTQSDAHAKILQPEIDTKR